MTLKEFHQEYPSWTIDAVKTGIHPGMGTYGTILRDFIENQDRRACPEFFCESPSCRYNLHIYEKFSEIVNSIDANEVINLAFYFFILIIKFADNFTILYLSFSSFSGVEINFSHFGFIDRLHILTFNF